MAKKKQEEKDCNLDEPRMLQASLINNIWELMQVMSDHLREDHGQDIELLDQLKHVYVACTSISEHLKKDFPGIERDLHIIGKEELKELLTVQIDEGMQRENLQ